MSKYLNIDERGSSFFADLFAADVGPGKAYRELSVNSFQAVEQYQREHPEDRDYRPVVETFVDPYSRAYDPETGRIDMKRLLDPDNTANKLALGDNGCGMDEKQLAENLTSLFRSDKAHGLAGNYGIGARVSTATNNPEGVEYRSWKNGKGHVATLVHYDDEKKYGLQDVLYEDGRCLNVVPIDEDNFTKEEIALMKPPFIGDHGTVVILHGRSHDEDTTISPKGLSRELDVDGRVKEHGAWWQTHIYNRQFFAIPHGIEFRLFTEVDNTRGWRKSDLFRGNRAQRMVYGAKKVLEEYANTSGTAEFDWGKVYFWIFPDADDELPERGVNPETKRTWRQGDVRKHQRMWYPWLTAAKDHSITAALYNGELFDLCTKADAQRMVTRFGVFAGQANVSIVVEPHPDLGPRSNMNRTQLLLGSTKLPWDDWGKEFAREMAIKAPALFEYLEKKFGRSDFETELEKLFGELRENDTFSVPMLGTRRGPRKTTDIPDSNGVMKPRGKRLPPTGEEQPERKDPDPNRVIQRRSSPKGRTKYRVIEGGREPGTQKLEGPLPKVKYMREAEHPTFRGRAAEYSDVVTAATPSGVLFINEDFDGFQKLIDETLTKTFSLEEQQQEALPEITEIVKLIYAVQLLFTVQVYRSSFAFGHGANWSQEEAKRLVDPDSLTASVLARPGLREQIKRRVNANHRLNRIKLAAGDGEQIAN